MCTQADRDDDLKTGRDLERKDAEIERLNAALENEAIVTRDLKEEVERVTRQRNEWQEKFMALARASLVLY